MRTIKVYNRPVVSDEDFDRMMTYKTKRKSMKIPLRLVAEFGGFSLNYLKTIEHGVQRLTDNVAKSYEKTFDIIEKNRITRVTYPRLSDK